MIIISAVCALAVSLCLQDGLGLANKFERYVMAIMLGLVAAIAFGFTPVILASMFMQPDSYAESHRFPIVAASGDEEVYLSTGTKNGETAYFFYRKQGDNALRQGFIPPNRTRIYEDPNLEEAYIVVLHREQHPWAEGNKWLITGPPDEKYQVHVPPDSVKLHQG